MFGLTFEKLFLIALIAALVLGPHRLPEYARQLARTIRRLRDLVDDTKSRTLTAEEWETLDPRRYDPRKIAADALASEPTEMSASTEHPTARPERSTMPIEQPTTPVEISTPLDRRLRRDELTEIHDQASRIRPGQRYLVTGDSAHPRRIRLDRLPPDDPRRLAAEGPAQPAEPRITSSI